MFDRERQTDNLYNVLAFARKAVFKDGGCTINSTHLLAGLFSVECEAKNILQKFGVRDNHIAIKKADDSGDTIVLSGEAASIVEFAQELAEKTDATKVGTEHLLLALLVGNTLARRVLCGHSIEVDKIVATLAKNTGTQKILAQQGLTAENEQTENLGPLEQFGYSLTGRAREGKLDPVVGRDEEIQRVIQVLCRRTKNNPVLTGEAGVGKSAVVEGLCQLIVQNKVPLPLKDKIIFSLDLAGLLAGTRFRGDFEKKLRDAIGFAAENKIILFIDEIHNLVGVGSTGESKMDAAEILKPALARGELLTLGATTIDEYRKHISKDPALERRFQVVNVEQPSVEDTIAILNGIREKYQSHHGVKITDEALKAAVQLSDRYITDRYLPDKAIDLIDEASSFVRLNSFAFSPEIAEIEEKISRLTTEKNRAKACDDFAKAEKFKNLIADETLRMEKLKLSSSGVTGSVVTEETIAQILSKWTGIPVARLSESESQKLLNIEKTLSQSVVGQEEAVHAVATALRRARAGLKDPKRPIGSFIFVGSTGVGKTELCKALAQTMFGDEKDIIVLDMSEYMEQNSVSKLIGAAPGFVGYEESGQLTEKVRRRPYSIVLFDEIEKAHPDIFNVLLQILDEGRLTDNKGRVVDFKNAVIIMTSNVGASIASKRSFRDSLGKTDYDLLRENYFDALKQTFKPEFLNRVDDIVVFHPLDFEATMKIAKIFVTKLCKRLQENGLTVEFSDSALRLLAEQGFSEEYGARPLKRVIQRNVEDKLSEALLSGKIKKGDEIKIDAFDGKILFKK